jgi:hypothetical protein
VLLLTSTSDKIQLITSAAGTVGVHADWIDLASGTVTAGRTNTNITTATTTDIVASPAASTSRNVKNLKISNNHASTANTVTLQHTDGATVIPLESVTLAAGERLALNEFGQMRVMDAMGREKLPGLGSPTGNSNVSDVVASAADTYLTGSSLAIGGRVQAASFFKWRMRATKTAAGTAAPVFNVRVGTAASTADTARATVTAGAQTAATDTGFFELDAILRSVGATAVIQMTLRMAHTGTTTGFQTTAQEQMLANTGASFDVTNAANVIGLSVNPGASGVWTFQEVTIEANNLIS